MIKILTYDITTTTAITLCTLFFADTSKENHRPRSNSMGIAQYSKGVSVVILSTENTIHRFPEMVGAVGIIHEVPVHPITWFKVGFPSGKIYTFRPSCFKLNDGSEEIKQTVKLPTSFAINHNIKKLLINKDKDQHIDTDFSIGMSVSIKSGEFTGEKGEVVRTSNGWIQVQTSLGKVAKRSHELEYEKNTEKYIENLTEFYHNNPSRPRSLSDVTSVSNNSEYSKCSIPSIASSPIISRPIRNQRSVPNPHIHETKPQTFGIENRFKKRKRTDSLSGIGFSYLITKYIHPNTNMNKKCGYSSIHMYHIYSMLKFLPL